MLEDDGKLREASIGSNKGKGWLDRIQSGQTVAYAVDKHSYSIGKITSISHPERKCVVHAYGPTSDGRLRVIWRPLFNDDGVETFAGTEAVKVTLELRQLISCLLYTSPSPRD